MEWARGGLLSDASLADHCCSDGYPSTLLDPFEHEPRN